MMRFRFRYVLLTLVVWVVCQLFIVKMHADERSRVDFVNRATALTIEMYVANHGHFPANVSELLEFDRLLKRPRVIGLNGRLPIDAGTSRDFDPYQTSIRWLPNRFPGFAGLTDSTIVGAVITTFGRDGGQDGVRNEHVIRLVTLADPIDLDHGDDDYRVISRK